MFFYVVFEPLYGCVNDVFDAGKSSSFCEFLMRLLADCLSLKYQWQQVYPSLQDFSQHSCWSNQCPSLNGLCNFILFPTLPTPSKPLRTFSSAPITIGITVYVASKFVLFSPAVSCMSGSSNLGGFCVEWLVAVQLLFCGVLPPGLVQYSSQHSCVIAVKLFLHTFSLRLRGASI